jgi:hypothetical protein
LLQVSHDQDLAVVHNELVQGGSEPLAQLVTDQGLAGAGATRYQAGQAQH